MNDVETEARKSHAWLISKIADVVDYFNTERVSFI